MNNTQSHIFGISDSDREYSILSTKLLSAANTKRLLDCGLLLKEVTFIKKEYRKVKLPTGKNIKAIFTSIEAVKALQFNNFDFGTISTTFCVGGKTAKALKQLGLAVAVEAMNAHDLGTQIATDYKSEYFVAFMGNLRRNELFEILAQNDVRVDEVVVYDTIILKKLLAEKFARILFFSPSGVKGYVSGGNNAHADVFCLGKSTADEAGKYFEHVFVAAEPTVKSLIDYVINELKRHEKN